MVGRCISYWNSPYFRGHVTFLGCNNKEKTMRKQNTILYCWWVRIPANYIVEVGNLSHHLQGLLHPRWCRISSINSIIALFILQLFLSLINLIPQDAITHHIGTSMGNLKGIGPWPVAWLQSLKVTAKSILKCIVILLQYNLCSTFLNTVSS